MSNNFPYNAPFHSEDVDNDDDERQHEEGKAGLLSQSPISRANQTTTATIFHQLLEQRNRTNTQQQQQQLQEETQLLLNAVRYQNLLSAGSSAAVQQQRSGSVLPTFPLGAPMYNDSLSSMSSRSEYNMNINPYDEFVQQTTGLPAAVPPMNYLNNETNIEILMEAHRRRSIASSLSQQFDVQQRLQEIRERERHLQQIMALRNVYADPTSIHRNVLLPTDDALLQRLHFGQVQSPYMPLSLSLPQQQQAATSPAAVNPTFTNSTLSLTEEEIFRFNMDLERRRQQLVNFPNLFPYNNPTDTFNFPQSILGSATSSAAGVRERLLSNQLSDLEARQLPAREVLYETVQQQQRKQRSASPSPASEKEEDDDARKKETIVENIPWDTIIAESDLICHQIRGHAPDSLFLSLAQMKACVLAPNDVAGKYKHGKLGTAGLCCKHCEGTYGGTGRYFPSTFDSFVNGMNPDKIVDHVVNRCQLCPPSVQQTIQALLDQEKAKAKRRRYGSRKRFFYYVWAQMHRLTKTAPEKDSTEVQEQSVSSPASSASVSSSSASLEDVGSKELKDPPPPPARKKPRIKHANNETEPTMEDPNVNRKSQSSSDNSTNTSSSNSISSSLSATNASVISSTSADESLNQISKKRKTSEDE